MWQMEFFRRIAAGRLAELFGEGLVDLLRHQLGHLGHTCAVGADGRLPDKSLDPLQVLVKVSFNVAVDFFQG